MSEICTCPFMSGTHQEHECLPHRNKAQELFTGPKVCCGDMQRLLDLEIINIDGDFELDGFTLFFAFCPFCGKKV
jgi:hypothetical protein